MQVFLCRLCCADGAGLVELCHTSGFVWAGRRYPHTYIQQIMYTCTDTPVHRHLHSSTSAAPPAQLHYTHTALIYKPYWACRKYNTHEEVSSTIAPEPSDGPNTCSQVSSNVQLYVLCLHISSNGFTVVAIYMCVDIACRPSDTWGVAQLHLASSICAAPPAQIHLHTCTSTETPAQLHLHSSTKTIQP